jgi:flagellar biosynthesis/type III secretory pathway chaperone
MPVIVPAITPATTVKAPATDNAASSAQAVLKSLQAMKAANDEILKQQAATLQKLEEIEKTAQEIRIYSKRG